MKRSNSRLFRSLPAVAAALAVLVGGGTAIDVAAGVVTPVSAQAAPAPGPDQPAGGAGSHHNRMGKMLMELDLSDAQKAQIRSIMADARKQNAGVTDRDARRTNMKAARDKVEAVLTPAQRTELHAKMDAMRQQDPAPAH